MTAWVRLRLTSPFVCFGLSPDPTPREIKDNDADDEWYRLEYSVRQLLDDRFGSVHEIGWWLALARERDTVAHHGYGVTVSCDLVRHRRSSSWPGRIA